MGNDGIPREAVEICSASPAEALKYYYAMVMQGMRNRFDVVPVLSQGELFGPKVTSGHHPSCTLTCMAADEYSDISLKRVSSISFCRISTTYNIPSDTSRTKGNPIVKPLSPAPYHVQSPLVLWLYGSADSRFNTPHAPGS